MIELHHNELRFRFPEVHSRATCCISFLRTLRIPDDNRSYPLPPGLSPFPLDHVDDYAKQVPEEWRRHGGVFLPMHQAEAMWINFESSYPMAVKVAAGKINAVTGEEWSNALSDEPSQDYLVLPDQPWLDGFYAGEGLIRQFVAMPLGEGYTAEEQITGAAEHGGVQIVVYPIKASVYERLRSPDPLMAYEADSDTVHMMACAVPSMGLAPGGLMQQEIYEDEHGIDVWDTSTRSRCFVHLLNSLQYVHVTGTEPPTRPPTASEYTAAGLPWFEYYAADRTALKGAGKLLGLDSVAAKKVKQGEAVLEGNEAISPTNVRTVRAGRNTVREGVF